MSNVIFDRRNLLMKNKIVATNRAPAAVGAYSQAVVRDGWVWCSGQIPLDPQTGKLVGENITEATHRAMENLEAVLVAAGSGWQAVVRCTIYLVRMSDFPMVNEVYASYFSDCPPARACVAVSALPKGAEVEIDAVATLLDGGKVD